MYNGMTSDVRRVGNQSLFKFEWRKERRALRDIK